MHRIVGAQLQVPSSAVVHEAQVPAERTDTKIVPCQRSPPPERNRNATTTSVEQKEAQKMVSTVGFELLDVSNDHRGRKVVDLTPRRETL